MEAHLRNHPGDYLGQCRIEDDVLPLEPEFVPYLAPSVETTASMATPVEGALDTPATEGSSDKV